TTANSRGDRNQWQPRRLPVDDRGGFHPPRERFCLCDTDPPLKVFLGVEDREIGRGATLLRRVQDVIESGGFHTRDLGYQPPARDYHERCCGPREVRVDVRRQAALTSAGRRR